MKRSIPPHVLECLPILLFLLLNLVIGILVVRDYGESTDEYGIYTYAESSLQAYSKLFHINSSPSSGNTATGYALPGYADYYGPAYAMLSTLFATGLHDLAPAWSLINGWHLSEFISFQIGVLSLYFLSRKWMGTWAAMGTALLFSTQPLLWGHAFINPKDIPFLGFFLASVTAGIYMVDALPAPPALDPQQPSAGSSNPTLRQEWRQLTPSKKGIAVAWIAILLTSFFLIIIGIPSRLVRLGVIYLYHASKTSRLGAWFSRLAAHAGQLPVDNYIHKAQAQLPHWEIVYFIAFLVLGLLLFPWIFTRYFRKLVRQGVIPSPRPTLHLFLNPALLAAGCLLGFTTSIRVAGPFAGVIVLLYAVYRSWKKAVLLTIPYALVAIVVSYLSWPYLWADPIHHFLATVTLMSRFPWPGEVLFQGKLWHPIDLPTFYLPFLMTAQFTEVVPVLFLCGCLVSGWQLLKRRPVVPFALFLLWLVLPLLSIIAARSVVYDNFRQELFLLPPAFLLAGVALEALFTKIQRSFFRVLILAAVILPGIVADVQLHPYQYAYYNSFVGGMPGAFRQYELDYWATSYREAAEYINTVAPAGASVVISDPVQVFQDYARQDLNLVPVGNILSGRHYDYMVLTTARNTDLTVCASLPPVKSITREGAILTVIRAPSPSEHGCP